MGLREAILVTMILGITAAATVEAKPARSGSVKPAADHKATEAKPDAKTDAKPAEQPAATDATARPGARDAGPDEAEAEAAEQAPPHLVGPRRVELGGAASIDLPAGYWLFERAEAQELARKMGNRPDSIVATILKPESEWLIVIHHHDDGYIDDSDADDLDADDLLDAIRKGTEEQNKERKAKGVPELAVDGWSDPPHYERAQHHLVWGITGHTKDGKLINFLTRILGRNGFLGVNLIDEPEHIAASKKEALAVVQAIHFHPGATYADHVASDRSSGIGLRGLVLGGAGVAVASKLGLLAKLLLVFKKLFIVIGAAIAGLFRWLFRRKPAASPDPMSMGPSSPPGDPPPG